MTAIFLESSDRGEEKVDDQKSVDSQPLFLPFHEGSERETIVPQFVRRLWKPLPIHVCKSKRLALAENEGWKPKHRCLPGRDLFVILGDPSRSSVLSFSS